MNRAFILILCLLSLGDLNGQTEIELLPQALVLPRDHSILGAKGAIRFNNSKNVFQGHNGSEWSEFLQPQSQRRGILAPTDFIAKNSDDVHQRDVAGGWFAASASNPIFLSNIDLDTGWKLDSLRIYFLDHSGSTNLNVDVAIYVPQVGASIESFDVLPAFESAGSSNVVQAETYIPVYNAGLYSNPSIFVRATCTTTTWPDANLQIKRVEVFTSTI